MSTPDPRPLGQFTIKAAGTLWWHFLLRGLLLLSAGLYVFVRPGLSAIAFAQLLGFLFLLDGVFTVIAGSVGRASSRVATIGRGLLLALLGIFIFSQPALMASIAVTTILYVVAFFVILNGIIEMTAAIRDRGEPEGEGSSFLGGVLSAGFGVLLIFAPLFFGLLIVRIFGIAALLIGLILVLLAFKFRKLRDAV